MQWMTALNIQRRVSSLIHQFVSWEEQINDTNRPLCYHTNKWNLRITCLLDLSHSLANLNETTNQQSPIIKDFGDNSKQFQGEKKLLLSAEGYISRFINSNSKIWNQFFWWLIFIIVNLFQMPRCWDIQWSNYSHCNGFQYVAKTIETKYSRLFF